MWPNSHRFLTEMVKLINSEFTDKTIVEFGCGSGNMLSFVKKEGFIASEEPICSTESRVPEDEPIFSKVLELKLGLLKKIVGIKP